MKGRPVRAVAQSLVIMLIAWGVMWLGSFFPDVRLDTTFSLWLHGLTRTAGVTGATLIGLGLASLLVPRAPRVQRRILREAIVHVIVLGVLLGGGAWVNEHLLKPAVAALRPNIVSLADQGALGITAEQFYSSMDKKERRAHLRMIMSEPGFDAISLAPAVGDHWTHEAGYSFPSGHAFSAALLATYFLAMGALFPGKQRRWIFHLLPWWAVLVAWSRVLLRVHRPEDVVWGGLLGILLGAAAVLLSDRLLHLGKTPTESAG